mmetsp:Transcript_11352/g.31419  ORF Transcript_11352/g.31419 Transcript_11352/m.31419 type:complete len:560 (+) Transcript_11352:143-1822(+)
MMSHFLMLSSGMFSFCQRRALSSLVRLCTFSVFSICPPHLQTRYSTLRAIEKEARAIDPERPLPPFPPKKSWSRHGEIFRLRRGTQLAASLHALLRHPQLTALPSAPRLLHDSPVLLSPISDSPAARPTDGRTTFTSTRRRLFSIGTEPDEPFAPPEPARQPQPQPPASLARYSPVLASTRGDEASRGHRVACSSPSAAPSRVARSRPLTSALAAPLSALLCALVLGAVRGHVALALVCCTLGLLVGILMRRVVTETIIDGDVEPLAAPAVAPSTPAALPSRRSPAQSCRAVAVEAVHSTPGVAQTAIVEPAAPLAVSDGEVLDPATASAVRAALDAVSLLFRHAQRGHCAPVPDPGGSFGIWKPHSTRDGVEIYTTDQFCSDRLHLSRLNGSLGVGEVAASPRAVHQAMEDKATRARIDPLWIRREVVRELDPRLLRIAGWQCERLQVVHESFRAPSVVVSPRDSVVVMAVITSDDGSVVAMAQQSADPQQFCVVSPKGFVRMTVACGGHIAEAAGQGCRLQYLNSIEPGGYIPKAVVRTTLPDRAMTVAKTRNVVTM